MKRTIVGIFVSVNQEIVISISIDRSLIFLEDGRS